MSIPRRLAELGGIASYRQLVAVAGRAELTRLLASGDVVRLRRGQFALPELDAAERAAHTHGGVLSHLSAALAWGWAVKTVPSKPHVTVPVRRRVRDRDGVVLHRRDLQPGEAVDGRTARDLTLEQCLRTLEFDEALAVADSALRAGYSELRLAAIARDARGPGAVMVRRVAAAADGRPRIRSSRSCARCALTSRT